MNPSKVSPLNMKIRAYLKANPDYLNSKYTETATKFNVSGDIVRHQARAVRQELANTANPDPITVPEPEEKEFSITDEVITRKENALIKDLKRQIEQSIKEYGILSDRYDVALGLRTQDLPKSNPSIKPNLSIDGEATAIIQISDGHFEKIIVPSTVNGLNSYSPEIAEKRMKKLAENTMKLIEKERRSTNIENLVLILGGDFSENSELHEQSEMTTAMSPMEAVLFSRKLLSKYITDISNYGKFKKIIVPCNRGNHTRITKKMNSSVDYKMNYEYILYNILKQDFSDSIFEWNIPDSDIAEFEIYGHTMRSFHGHNCKFSGGIGGLTVPLNKFIMRQDQIRKVDYNFMHHYHNYSFPTSRCTLNGSICGYDSYAFSLGCEYQPPMQSFQLFDKKKGMTIKAPIFCD